jgi:hypothetical protein
MLKAKGLVRHVPAAGRGKGESYFCTTRAYRTDTSRLDPSHLDPDDDEDQEMELEF